MEENRLIVAAIFCIPSYSWCILSWTYYGLVYCV